MLEWYINLAATGEEPVIHTPHYALLANGVEIFTLTPEEAEEIERTGEFGGLPIGPRAVIDIQRES